ncbi:MAG: UDP-N-acetylmuramyl-tripeptide synthetase [bacterium]|nr:UDP-N-acetylmuramyl-tripeptide synthetase [bacterium]
MEQLKGLPLVKILYWIPGLVPLYHFILAWLGAVIYRSPSKKIFVVGVTGTKGKTTTLEVLNAIFEASGRKTALLSSLRIKIGEKSAKNMIGNTMPGRFYIQRFLRSAVAEGCKYALIEVTSQGVSASRHRFIDWNSAILTNLAPEHIEAHGTFKNYREAKLSFLRYVGYGKGKIFLNRDDNNFNFFLNGLKIFKPVVYSHSDEETQRILPKIYPARSAGDITPLPFLMSEFNQTNVAAAVALAKEVGIEERAIEEALRHFRGVPGRMEFVQWRPFAIVIDYAHTVESLEAVYRVLRQEIKNSRQHSDGKLICVLGAAGGGRDKWKRPAMGKVAAEYCDKILLTNEDPYDENPMDIIDQIAAGFLEASGGKYHLPDFEKIFDRGEAIARAISLASPGDVVVMTGKGSEDWIHSQMGIKISWSEKGVVEEVLKSLKTKAGETKEAAL